MGITTNQLKITSLVVLGNILEYYDFLLFMHLGPIITPLYFPSHSSKETHILSLLLFGLAFVIRPIGGYVFGRLSDVKSRKLALTRSVKWALLPAFGIALLPTYDTLGVWATALFVFFRLFQGIALGGEYPNAGTYLMEYYKSRHGLVSGILSASGIIGSLVGFGFALICLSDVAPSWLWRFGFLFGGIAGFLSYRMRAILPDISVKPPNSLVQSSLWKSSNAIKLKLAIVTFIGMLVGTAVWIPMTYSNFFVTKILGLSNQEGLMATFIALISYLLFVPLSGLLYDRFNPVRYMICTALMVVPMSFASFYLLTQGNIPLAQLGLILCASGFGAPIHAMMNSLFPKEVRGRAVAMCFMIGLSIGGMAPSLAGYIADKTNFQYTPALLVSLIAVTAAALFYRLMKYEQKVPSVEVV